VKRDGDQRTTRSQEYGVPGFAKVLPSEIEWIPEPTAPGVELALLLGNPEKPGPFVVRVRLPADTKIMPHTHPVPRTYCVLVGFRLSRPEAFPAQVPHYQATGPTETVIEIHPVGPSTTDFLNPMDDPRKG